MASEVQHQHQSADLFPFAGEDREGLRLSSMVARCNKGELGDRDGKDFAEDSSPFNAQTYEYALRNSGEKTRRRFEAQDQKLAFDAAKYEGAGPLWMYGTMT